MALKLFLRERACSAGFGAVRRVREPGQDIERHSNIGPNATTAARVHAPTPVETIMPSSENNSVSQILAACVRTQTRSVGQRGEDAHVVGRREPAVGKEREGVLHERAVEERAVFLRRECQTDHREQPDLGDYAKGFLLLPSPGGSMDADGLNNQHEDAQREERQLGHEGKREIGGHLGIGTGSRVAWTLSRHDSLTAGAVAVSTGPTAMLGATPNSTSTNTRIPIAADSRPAHRAETPGSAGRRTWRPEDSASRLATRRSASGTNAPSTPGR